LSHYLCWFNIDYFSETVVDNLLKRSNVRLINRTYVDAITECWQTLCSYRFNYHIRGCNSPNFAKNCIESTIHGLLCMTKGAGKCSWWPEINPEVSNVVTPGQFAIIINCWYITALHAKTGIEANAWGFLWIDTHIQSSNSASHRPILNIRWSSGGASYGAKGIKPPSDFCVKWYFVLISKLSQCYTWTSTVTLALTQYYVHTCEYDTE